ncbi:DUF2141 domain-containing protein [Undibacterium flavidum]|uniref:DUF2141 domain-containing protein n=1 Tax=Undibacterium flavidum TaxID=2762297 RepID=A0ABR6YAY8_9BURK|nr:DUF2141 domain-containing protein [Undibacterium flavidum]MBC3873813.1 DUF2141 domain-containing protein [Undibacterium flavidum]
MIHKLFGAIGFVFMLAAQNASAADLKITISQIQSGSGELRIALYKQADQWLTKSFKKIQEPAVAGSVTVIISDIPAGDYAVALFHDVDSDGKMAKNFLGIPKEPYGFSNDARGSFGPPSFDASKFAVPAEGAAITIKLE